jgi:hypothetical protein
MWMLDFWENAEQRCDWFSAKEENEVKDDAGREVG